MFSTAPLTLGSFVLAASLLGAPVDDLTKIREHVKAGRFAAALRDVDVRLERLEKPDRTGRLDLLQLQAHCLFGLGSYRDCESALKHTQLTKRFSGLTQNSQKSPR